MLLIWGVLSMLLQKQAKGVNWMAGSRAFQQLPQEVAQNHVHDFLYAKPPKPPTSLISQLTLVEKEPCSIDNPYCHLLEFELKKAVPLATGTQLKLSGMNDLLAYNMRWVDMTIERSEAACPVPRIERWTKDPHKVEHHQIPYKVEDTTLSPVSQRWHFDVDATPWRSRTRKDKDQDQDVLVLIIPRSNTCRYRITQYTHGELWFELNWNARMRRLQVGDGFPGLWQASDRHPAFEKLPDPGQAASASSVLPELRVMNIKRVQQHFFDYYFEAPGAPHRLASGTIVRLNDDTKVRYRRTTTVYIRTLSDRVCPLPYMANFEGGELRRFGGGVDQVAPNTVKFHYTQRLNKDDAAAFLLFIPNDRRCVYQLVAYHKRILSFPWIKKNEKMPDLGTSYQEVLDATGPTKKSPSEWLGSRSFWG